MHQYKKGIAMNVLCTILGIILLGQMIHADILFPDKKDEFDLLYYYQGPRTYVLSYPRSANTWIRYCAEFLTRRPTMMCRIGYYDPKNYPLAWQAGFDLDLAKQPLEKAHIYAEMAMFRAPDPDTEKLILLVRNPKEAITRHEGCPPIRASFTGEFKIEYYSPKEYFNNLTVYDSWNPENRLLIYYEDLLLNPRETLSRLLIFLDESFTYFENFLAEYEYHKKVALGVYSESKSRGSDLLYHSRKIDPVYRMQIDQWIEELYPDLWHRYLKDRYAEEYIQYDNN